MGPAGLWNSRYRSRAPCRARTGVLNRRRDSTRQLVEEGALQALDEAVVPRVARSRADMPDSVGRAGLVEGPSVLAAAVGEQPPEGPAGCRVDREHPRGEEAGRRLRGELGADLDDGVRVGRIAGGVLPDFPHPLELPDVEGIQANQLAGLLGRHVEGTDGAGPGPACAGSARSATPPSGRCRPPAPPAACSGSRGPPGAGTGRWWLGRGLKCRARGGPAGHSRGPGPRWARPGAPPE